MACTAAGAADKAFKRDDLADSAIKLEAQIKSEAGPVAKTTATLRTDADAAFRRNDFRTGLQILGQIAATTPEDSGNWLRLARTIFQIRPASSSEQTFLLERASTAAYIAYQRAGNAARRRMRWPCSAGRCPSASCGVRRWMRCGCRSTCARSPMSAASTRRCATSTASGCSTTPWIPTAPRRAPASSSRRTSPSASTSRRSWRWPAPTSRRCREGKQLCVDGLKHGERYNINLRAGLPSTVKESLPKSAEFNIYVRDRKPFVRFTGRAYVLPRTGQRGIPLVSVNTPAVNVNVFRIGDRNLINTVIDSDFQGTLAATSSRLGDERGVKVWSGELATATTLNQDVMTAFPVDQALGDLQPGVYVMTAAAKGPGSGDDDGSLATQWFIVSDMGLTAFSGNDGIHVFVNSLASTEAVAKAEVRLVARNNEILATRKTDDAGHVLFEAGLARGEGGLSPAMLTVMSEKADYAFLSLKTNAFDLTDRGVSGPRGAGRRRRLRLCRARRLPLQRDRLSDRAAARRAGQRDGRRAADAGDRAARRRRIPPRRCCPTRARAAARMAMPLNSAVPTGTWRVRAFTDPKGSSVGETTFMVEDYIPERIEFDVSAKEKLIKAEVPVELKVDGHFLYGAPASGLQLEGDMLVAPAASGRPGYPGYQFGVADEETASNERTPIENLPEADANGVATFPVSLAKAPTSTRPQEAQIFIRMAETGGRAVERKLVLPVAPQAALIGIKPLFGDKSVAEGDKAEFDVVFVGARRQAACARRPALRTAEDGVALPMVSPELFLGI